MENKIKTGLYILKYLGPRWLLYRLYYAFVQKSGLLARRMPVKSWNNICDYQENRSALSFIPADFTKKQLELLQNFDEQSNEGFDVIIEADAVLNGEFRLFSFHKKKLGMPPDWHKNAMTGEVCDNKLHWSKIPDFGYGDIKCIWEINRFPWTFALARSYARTGQEKYAETYWLLFENWLEENPPNIGVNWKCGQEATFRLIATCFARRAFANSRATSHERLQKWRKFVAFTAERIAGNIGYALSQNNNHGISECIGLYTAANILPDMPQAEKYSVLAEKNLIEQLETLVYKDGAFSQHSTVYHRVVLHDLAWYLAFKKALGSDVEKHIVAAANRALQFMVNITDLNTGLAPLHGPNDGANILPLTNSKYLDFRPAITLLGSLLNCRLAVPAGPQNEALLWFSQTNSQGKILAQNNDPGAVTSGWFMFSGKNSRLFCYAPEKFIHRPAQADLLHVDFWWKGLPITLDPGSFSYNCSGRFSEMFKSTRVHNTVCVNNEDQLKMISRFLFLPWPRIKTEWYEKKQTFIATHKAYKDSGILHTRKIQHKGNDLWLIEDTLVSNRLKKDSHSLCLHWLLCDYNYSFIDNENTLLLHTLAGEFKIAVSADCPIDKIDLVRADSLTDEGWWSPYYFHARPALSLSVSLKLQKKAIITTRMQPA
jgi:hypothetical protein